MIKAIIFDFFGVLVSEGFKQFRDNYFPGDDNKWQRAISLVNKHDSGQITKADFIKGMAKISHKDYDFVAQNINDNRPNETLIKYIREQLKLRYKISVLSNAGDDYLSQMLKPQDVALFDDIVLSYRYKMIKPQQEIFELAAERLRVLTTECLFIDDSPNHCDGARRAGMKTIFYKDFPSFKSELEKILSSDAND
ncbi:MAG TPA: HAD family phosphatase [Candidatus Saccharimonadales bacterium]|nr:HAD family phosphatase [Candidatus Saccharimonadales bacterium]